MTRKWYATLRHLKMYPHTKFGIPTSKNIGDMDRTRKWDGRTDGRTVRLLYYYIYGGIKKVAIFDWKWGRNSAPRVGQKIPCLGVSRKIYVLAHIIPGV